MTSFAATAAEASRAAGLDPGALLGPLRSARGLVLAVSGGPDSTALMLLAAAWPDRPPAIVVTVDHGLRPQSAAEAGQVAENAAALGLPCRVLQCAGLHAGGNLQARAREARYALLAEAAREAGFDTIVAAHHQEDQAETFLLRLARGSGVYGLGAMAAVGDLGGLRLARPLLGVSRSRLHALCDAAGMPVSDDPSNQDPRFDRARMRALVPSLAEHGLGAERLAGTAARLARAADALDTLATELIAANFTADRYGRVEGALRPLLETHAEIALRALSRVTSAVGGATYGPRLDRLEALYAALAGAGEQPLVRTLHGVVVRAAAGRIAFGREWGRAGLPALTVEPGSPLLWDGRYQVQVGAAAAGGLRIAALGEADRRLEAAGVRSAALRALPGLYEGRTLVAAPSGIRLRDGGALAHLAAECLVPARLGLAVAA